MKFHEELNPVIWDRFKEKRIGGAVSYQLKPEVADKLKEIADAFIESLEIPLDAVTDCVITGSSASYNYTPYSDIDLHLKVDFDKVHEDCPVVKGYLNAIKAAFNSNHDIHIHGIPVEVYAEGINEDTVHNGLYSLWQAKWIDEPQKIPPTENDAAVNAKFKEIAEQIDQIEDSELAIELLNKVYEMRKAGLTEAGEFSTENLAFKKLRDEGYLQKLRDIKKAKVDKELSLEKRTESAEGLDSRCYLRILRDSVEYIKALYRIQKQERHSTTLNRNYIDSLRFICTIPKYSIEIETTQNFDSNIELSKNIGFLILNAQVEITKQLQDNDANIKQVTIVVPGINMTDFERAEIDKYGISESLDEDDDYEYDETDPEQCIMHKLIYWGNLKAGDSIKHTTFHVYQDDMDDTYNELCDRHDNQIGLYATEKELQDQMELYTKQRIDAHNKQGLDNWEFIGVEFKDEDMNYYNSRNKYEAVDGFYNPEYIRGKNLQKGHVYILSKEMDHIGYTTSDFTEREIQKIRPYVKFKFNDAIFEVDRDTKLVYRGKFRDPYNEPGNRSIKLEIMGTGVILELSEGDTFEEVDQKNESEKVYIKTESIELDPDVLKVVNEVGSDVNFFNNFTELKPGQYLVRRQTYTTHYIPTRDFDYKMYETQPEFPKESHWDREGYFDVKLMEEPVVAYVKGRYENPLQVVNCTKLCTYYDSVGDIDEGGTWYKEFYHEILRIDSVEPINYETANHTTEEAYAILGLEYPYKLL